MKTFAKALSLMLALLFLVGCFAACGGTKETEGEVKESATEAKDVATEKVDEFGRPWIEDSVPADVSYANATKNTITFLNFTFGQHTDNRGKFSAISRSYISKIAKIF